MLVSEGAEEVVQLGHEPRQLRRPAARQSSPAARRRCPLRGHVGQPRGALLPQKAGAVLEVLAHLTAGV
jgi:hypothetical protein